MPVTFSIATRAGRSFDGRVHDRRERRGDLALLIGAREQAGRARDVAGLGC